MKPRQPDILQDIKVPIPAESFWKMRGDRVDNYSLNSY